jgi:hypothetical protein
MMRSFATVIGASMVTGVIVTGALASTRLGAQGFTVVMDCGASSEPHVRTTLYFGLARPKGAVSELEWQLFLRDEVTRRFPDGLTVWEAEGQWLTPAGTIDRERTKVLLLVHPDTAAARQSVRAVIDAYRAAFDQQSVLWESSRVCATS